MVWFGQLRKTYEDVVSNYRCPAKIIHWYGRTQKKRTVLFKTDLFDNKTVAMPAEPSALISYV